MKASLREAALGELRGAGVGPLLQHRAGHLDVELQAPRGGARRGRPGCRPRCGRAPSRRPEACTSSCATRARRARAARPRRGHRAAAASANSLRTQPTSPAGIRSALPPSACATSCAPRHVPSTGSPRACMSAMTSRSRSSGASPSVPSGLTIPPSTISPSNSPAGGSGCVERVPGHRAHAERRRAAARAPRAACRDRAGRRAPWDSQSRPAFSPIGAAEAPTRQGTADACKRAAGDGTALHRLGIDLPRDPHQPRDDGAARLGRRPPRARGRADVRRAGRARAPRIECLRGSRRAAPRSRAAGS